MKVNSYFCYFYGSMYSLHSMKKSENWKSGNSSYISADLLHCNGNVQFLKLEIQNVADLLIIRRATYIITNSHFSYSKQR